MRRLCLPCVAIGLFAVLSGSAFLLADQPEPLLPVPRARPIPGARAGTGPASAPATSPTKPTFIVGVWSQPVDSIGVWKARGVNTMFNYEAGGRATKVSMDDYTGACAYNGMFIVRQPNPNIQEDVSEPYLLAWMHNDEPDNPKPPTDPKLLIEGYKKMKATDPSRPVFVNFSGGNVLFKKTPRSFYDGYIKGADWIGNDFYPITGWNRPDWLFRVGEICDILKEWSRGKPQLVYIECSDQKLAWTPEETRGVSPDEMTSEIWQAVVHGAIGIVYFPQQFDRGKGFHYDATPEDVSIEMARQNKRLTDLGTVLSRPANPPGARVTVPKSFEAGWRRAADGTLYVIVINETNDLRKHEHIAVSGAPGKTAVDLWSEGHALNLVNNEFTDDFHPLEVKLYTISRAQK